MIARPTNGRIRMAEKSTSARRLRQEGAVELECSFQNGRCGPPSLLNSGEMLLLLQQQNFTGATENCVDRPRSTRRPEKLGGKGRDHPARPASGSFDRPRQQAVAVLRVSSTPVKCCCVSTASLQRSTDATRLPSIFPPSLTAKRRRPLALCQQDDAASKLQPVRCRRESDQKPMRRPAEPYSRDASAALPLKVLYVSILPPCTVPTSATSFAIIMFSDRSAK